GLSSETAVPASPDSAASRRVRLLAGNGLARLEQLLERLQLRGGPDRDQHVAEVDRRVRARGRVEAARRLPQRDDERPGVATDVEVTDRPAGVVAAFGDLDLLH